MNAETIMLGTMTVLVSIVGYLLARFFSKTESWGVILNNLDKMVSVISVRLESLSSITNNNTKDISHLRKLVFKQEKELAALRSALEFCQTKNPSCSLRGTDDPS